MDSIFGPPLKFLSDNGGEFNNEGFRSMSEEYDISVRTTAAESLWSNGLCEWHNAILEEMLQKTMVEGNCSLEVALNWAIHVKNSLANIHGFSPYQLAIYYTPRLPSVLYNRPSAMDPSREVVGDILKQNLNTMAAARKSFIEAESSEKIKSPET